MAVQEFISPTSLSEAQQAVSEGAVSAWLAGGTDLLVGIRLGVRDPARVIDLKQIPELTAIEIDETSARIGAAASAFDVLHNSEVPSLFPGLAEALEACGRCGGSLKVIACIEDQDIIDRILAHLREKEHNTPHVVFPLQLIRRR